MRSLDESYDTPEKSKPALSKSSNDFKSKQSWDNLEDANDPPWELQHPTDIFSFVHSLVYKAMDDWAGTEQAKQHPFYSLYQHVKYKGMNHHTQWDKLCTILHIATLGQYINFVLQCPAVATDLQLHWDWSDNDL
jgi:hypothetical protein